MKLTDKHKTAALYTVVCFVLTANIYFAQWELALSLMCMMLFIELIPLFTTPKVEPFSYAQLATALKEYDKKQLEPKVSNAKDTTPTAQPIKEIKDNKKSEAGAVALGVAKTLAKNDRVKALGKMALNSAADRLQDEVKDALKKEKQNDSKDSEDEEEEKGSNK